MEGIERVVVGYTGGKEKNPTYDCMLDATEAVLIEYDPSIISYDEILISWSKQHNPQYKPPSKQYKSVIWVKNKGEREAAMKRIEAMKTSDDYHIGFGTKSKMKPRKVYVDVESVGPFYKAEEYHQDYLRKHTGGTGYF